MLALNNQRQIPQELTDQAFKQTHELLNMVSGVDFVMLCSSDGFELALASKKNLGNSGKIAAVSSSILAMVSAFISSVSTPPAVTCAVSKVFQSVISTRSPCTVSIKLYNSSVCSRFAYFAAFICDSSNNTGINFFGKKPIKASPMCFSSAFLNLSLK